MSKINLAVMFGGCSPEHEISKLSAETIIANISEELYNAIPVYVTKEGKWLMYDGGTDNIKNVQWEKHGTPALLSPDRSHKGLLRIVGDKAKLIPIDVAFPVFHGENGEDGAIQGLLNISNIPYVGSGVLSSGLCMDKSFTKIVADSCGIRQAEHLKFKSSELADMDDVVKKVRAHIKYPCFVKPARLGSSIGISKASNKKELIAALDEAAKYDNKILVERGITGRELECAILGSGGDDTEASIVGEIKAAADFYDFDAKYNNKQSKTVVPADIPDDVSDQIRISALKIFKALDCSGLARVDFFWEEATNKVIFNEINTMPGFTPISMYPMLWNASGIDTSTLIDRLVKLALGDIAEASPQGVKSRG